MSSQVDLSGSRNSSDHAESRPVPKARRMGKTDVMAHFVEHFAARGLTLGRADAREFLEELHRLCVQQLNETGEFRLPRMAKFVLRQRPARAGRNPRTGEAIQVKARKAVTVRIARQLKDSLSEPVP